MAYTLLVRGVTDRDLHLFDTFAGMPEPTEKATDCASVAFAS